MLVKSIFEVDGKVIINYYFICVFVIKFSIFFFFIKYNFFFRFVFFYFFEDQDVFIVFDQVEVIYLWFFQLDVKFVVKFDQLIKCCGKSGFFVFNKIWFEVKVWIVECVGKIQQVEYVEGVFC